MGTYTNTPNLFKFATSELSQDAFICWTLDGLNYSGKREDYPKCALNNFSKKFFDLIITEWNHFCSISHINTCRCTEKAEDIISIDIKQQSDKIDIFAVVTFNDRSERAIIIEDKTFTSQHDNQLEHYKNIVCDSYGFDKPICIYLKIGFPFFDEQVVSLSGYVSIFRGQILKVMSEFDGKLSSDIFRSYYEHLSEIEHNDNEIISALYSRDYETALKTHIGQYITMDMLVAHGDNLIVTYGADNTPEYILSRMEIGKNKGGSPWTQYNVLYPQYCDEYNKGYIPAECTFVDNITYRIDLNKEGYYISIRQYNNSEMDTTAKMARLEKLKSLFQEAVHQVEEERKNCIPPVKFAHLFSYENGRGKKESVIASVYFRHLSPKDFTLLQELLRIVTQAFTKLIKDSFI